MTPLISAGYKNWSAPAFRFRARQDFWGLGYASPRDTRRDCSLLGRRYDARQ